MPNRIIKESIHGSETVNRMNDFQFRLWVSLITYVDDYGRGDARPAIIKGSCFPLRSQVTENVISKGLKSLAEIGGLMLYRVDGREYLAFPNWADHQNVRNKRSKFPAPEDGEQVNALDSNCNQSPAKVPVIQSNPNPYPNPNTNKGRFAPPTLDEVKAYCTERGNGIDPQYFIDYYQSQKWKKSNGQPVSDWKACIRQWEQREKPKTEVKGKTTYSGTQNAADVRSAYLKLCEEMGEDPEATA